MVTVASCLVISCAGDPSQGGTTTGIATQTGSGPGPGPDSEDDSFDTTESEPTVTASNGESSGGPPPAECGDAVTEGSEECDLGSANGQGDFCKEDCTINECPDGYLGPGELCDDGNFDDTDECRNNCTLLSCGNGVEDPGEQCDDGNLVNTDSCLNTCVDAICGDSFIRTSGANPEICDNRNVGDQTCITQGWEEGSLFCADGCMEFDTSNCRFTCGDDGIDPGEECDGTDLGGLDCLTVPGSTWDDGALGCTGLCNFNTGSCTDCGDDIREGNEQCDGDDNPSSCVLQGYDEGAIGCTGSCTFDVSNCTECGDGTMNGTEECDQSDGIGPCSAVNGMYGCGSTACDGNCNLTFGACELAVGVDCDGNESDCCTGACDTGDTGLCCVENGNGCTGNSQCCSGDCDAGGSGTCQSS